MKILLWLGLPL